MMNINYGETWPIVKAPSFTIIRLQNMYDKSDLNSVLLLSCNIIHSIIFGPSSFCIKIIGIEVRRNCGPLGK